eukprot:2079879-Prorocentrum_lima.AAC.1
MEGTSRISIEAEATRVQGGDWSMTALGQTQNDEKKIKSDADDVMTLQTGHNANEEKGIESR